MNFLNRRARLYKRVSSDEQKHNNSLPYQDEVLNNFCKSFNITIVGIYVDDGYSAMSFERPDWKRMLNDTKKNKGAADLLLFKDWSRFSRAENMGESYMMLYKLNKMGLEVQAIEQIIDFNIPESLHLISIYIASPAVENLRRASNTRNGIRRSLKDGRFCNNPPFGYSKQRDERNKPFLTIIPEKAKIIQRVFTEYLEGGNPKDIIARARKSAGHLNGNSTFQKIITNPVYAGLIRIPAFQDEPEQMVPGIHTPLISQDIYYAAVRKYKFDTSPKPRTMDLNMPLRGVIICDSCSHQMTGGRSRGRHGGYFYYYRCLKCEGYNFSVKKTHDELETILSGISLNQEQIDLFISEVDKEMKAVINENRWESDKLEKELRPLEAQLQSLETKFISNQIDFETYQKHFPALRGLIAEKRLKLESIQEGKDDVIDLFRATLPKMKDMNLLYASCNAENKQLFLKLLFPLGLYKSKKGHRTPELFDLFDPKAAIDAGLVIGNKSDKSVYMAVTPFSSQPGSVIEPSIVPLLQFISKLAA